MSTVPVISGVLLGPADPTKPLLVLGPSLGTSATTLWSYAAETMSTGCHVIAWDLPGHGTSAPATDSFSMADLARDRSSIVMLPHGRPPRSRHMSPKGRPQAPVRPDPDRRPIVPLRHDCQSSSDRRTYLSIDRLTNRNRPRCSRDEAVFAPVGTIFAMSSGEWLPRSSTRPRTRRADSEYSF